MKHAQISLRNVSKIYQMGKVQVPALVGASMDVHKGEFIVLLGPSGSGKSTALNMLGALDRPTEGQVLLEGRDISHMDDSALARYRGKKVGFVFQSFNLLPSLTALENVMLPMRFQDIPTGHRRERAAKLLEQVDLSDRIHHLPSELSGGQQQRVSIARALANDPDIVIADEPTGNLDSKTGEKIMDMLEELNTKKKKTVIIVTHDHHLVGKLRKKIYKIHDGVIKG